MKTKNIKVVHKTTGKIETTQDEGLYKILKKVPGVPSKFNLTTSQKYWWKWFAAELVNTNQFTQVDLIHLQQSAFWLDARCQAYEIINDKNKLGDLKGMVQTFKGGATNITGWMSIVKDADKALDNISAHFGLSIKDRKKLGEVKAPDNQLNLLEEFEKKHSS